MTEATAHELTHHIRVNFEEGYNALRDFVTDHLLEEGENLIQMARDKIRRSAKPAEMSLGDAVEEVVADACEEMLSNTKYAELMAQENQTLAQSIKNWITDFVEKIKTAVSPDARRHREAEVMRKFAAELQEIWDKALVGATSVSESGELSEGEAESGTTAAGTAKYQLREVEPVQPTSGEWERTSTTEEALKAFPNMWNVAAEESETRNPTQISSTVSTYRKIFDILKAQGFTGTILDASSGMGIGTRTGRKEYGFDVEDIEPYPDKSYTPMYRDYSKLHKKYDAIISSAVLNVLPQDQRDALVVKMGQLLKHGN